MKQFLLKLFSKEELFREILRREGFATPEREVETETIWKEVFHRNPLLKDYLKKREIELLKLLTLNDRSPEFVLGQIFENRLWQRYDVPSGATSGVESLPKKEIISQAEFLKKWNSTTYNQHAS